jgi:hypothetical protein
VSACTARVKTDLPPNRGCQYSPTCDKLD